MNTSITALNTEEVATRLIELCGKGQFLQAQEELYDADIVSIDPDGSRTIDAENMYAKEQSFLNGLKKTISISYSAPLFAGNFFTTILSMAVETSKAGYLGFSEICVYQVAEGKIIFEQFFRDNAVKKN
jgi:SnoaL-like protein